MNWKKLETIEECKSLIEGDELVKYPVDGEAVNNLNLSDSSNLRYGKVEGNNAEGTLIIKLMMGKDVDTSGDGLLEGNEPLNIEHMVKEEKWWFKKNT